MEKFIKKVPLPIVAVALGFAGLGNLLQSYSNNIRMFCGIIAFLLLVPIIIKILFYNKDFKNEINNPIMASVFAGLPMTLMLLATYVKPFIGTISFYIWLFAIALHVYLIVAFSLKYLVKLDIKKVFASYYILFVGIVVASVTAPAFEKQGLGTAIFWFGFVAFLLLFSLVTYRHIKFKEIPEAARPLVCIYAAPMSLCIAGYVQSVANKNPNFLFGMLVVSIVIYVIMFGKTIKFLLTSKFYPSFAAFTFPFVISGIASKMSMAFFAKIGHPISFLPSLVTLQTIVAIAFCLAVLIKYIQFIKK